MDLNIKAEITEEFFKESVQRINSLRCAYGYISADKYNENCILARKLQEHGAENCTINFFGYVAGIGFLSEKAKKVARAFDDVNGRYGSVNPDEAWAKYEGPTECMMF